MRLLYKALASVGMLALSTAAALGVRHLTKAAQKRKNETDNENAQNNEPTKNVDEKQENTCINLEEKSVSSDVSSSENDVSDETSQDASSDASGDAHSDDDTVPASEDGCSSDENMKDASDTEAKETIE